MNTLQNLQGTFSDMHKDIFGFRPQLTESEWGDAEFLSIEITNLEAIIDKMSTEEKAQNGWSVIEADDVDCDDSDDAAALASAGFGTDEDYGYASEVM